MKLIIDIPEKVVTTIQNGEDYRYDLHTSIAQSIPYEERPQGEWISKEEALKIMCEKCPVYNCVSGCNSYRSIEKMQSVQSQRPKGDAE